MVSDIHFNLAVIQWRRSMSFFTSDLFFVFLFFFFGGAQSEPRNAWNQDAVRISRPLFKGASWVDIKFNCISYFCSFFSVLIHLFNHPLTETDLSSCSVWRTLQGMYSSWVSSIYKHPSTQSVPLSLFCGCPKTGDASTPKHLGAKQTEVMEICSKPTIPRKNSGLLQRGWFWKSHPKPSPTI